MLGRPHGVVVVDLVDLVDVDDINKDDIVIVVVDEDHCNPDLTGQPCVLGRPDWSRLPRRETSKDVPLRHRSAERAT